MTMTAIYYLSDLSCTSNQPLLIDTRRPQQAAKRKFHKTSSSIDKGLSNKSAKKREFFSSLQGIPLSSSYFVCFVLGRCLNLNNLNPNLPSFLQKTCSTIQTLTWAVSQFLRHLNIILGSKYSRRVACGEAVRLRRPHCSNIRWDQKNLLQKAETISWHTSYLVVKDY